MLCSEASGLQFENCIYAKPGLHVALYNFEVQLVLCSLTLKHTCSWLAFMCTPLVPRPLRLCLVSRFSTLLPKQGNPGVSSEFCSSCVKRRIFFPRSCVLWVLRHRPQMRWSPSRCSAAWSKTDVCRAVFCSCFTDCFLWVCESTVCSLYIYIYTVGILLFLTLTLNSCPGLSVLSGPPSLDGRASLSHLREAAEHHAFVFPF